MGKKRSFNLIAMILMVMLVVFNSCGEYRADMNTSSEDQPIKPDDPVVVEPVFDFNWNVERRSHEVIFTWKVTESNYGLSDSGQASVDCTHERDKYAAAKDVALQYSQERTSHSDPSVTTKSSSDNRKVYEEAVKTTAQVEDGNLVYANSKFERIEYTLNEKQYDAPYIKLGKKYLKAINRLPGNTHYGTRAEEFKADSVCREFVWGVPYEFVGVNLPSGEEEIRDTLRVYQMDTNDIAEETKIGDNREVINDTDERVDVIIDVLMKDKTHHEITESTILKRKLSAREEYDKVVKNFLYTWRYDNSLKIGAASDVRTDGNFKVSGRTDSFSAMLNNQDDLNPIETAYDFYHERAIFENEWGIKSTFDFITPSMAERNTYVAEAEARNGYQTRRLNNAIGTSYLGYAQDAAESVFLLVENAHIKEEGWDKSSFVETVSADEVVWDIVYEIHWSDGRVERIPFRFRDSRSLVCDTNWKSEEKNTNHSTSGVTKSLTKTEAKSDTKDGATAKWKRQYISLSSVTSLNASSQENRWSAMEPNDFSAEYRDKTFSAGSVEISATNSSSLSDGVKKDGYTYYAHADNLRYSRGNDVRTSAAPGTIIVPDQDEPTFFPPEWGKLLEALQTVSNNKTHDGYVYTWSLHFEEGVLPVVVIPGSTRPDWEFSYFEYTSNKDFNSGTYNPEDGTWYNTIAKDKAAHMTWSRDSKEKANKAYKEAEGQNWDEGHMVEDQLGRHASVKTSRYQLTVEDGRLTAIDLYNGNYMDSWK